MLLQFNVTIWFGAHSCIVVGATKHNALDVMQDYARYYLGEAGYAHVEAEIAEECAVCKGKGRKLKPRCKATYVDCMACDRGGYVNVTPRVRLERSAA